MILYQLVKKESGEGKDSEEEEKKEKDEQASG